MKVAKFTKHLTIALSTEIYDEIEKNSDELEISKGEYVRDILAKSLDPDQGKKKKG